MHRGRTEPAGSAARLPRGAGAPWSRGRRGTRGEGEAMKRKLAGLVLLAALGGQASAQIGSFAGTLSAPRRGSCDAGGCSHGAYQLPQLPGYVGATGEPLHYNPSAARAASDPADTAARATFAQSLPPDIAAAVLYKQIGKDGIIQASIPPGVGPGGPGGLTVLPPQPPIGSGLPGAVAAVGALTNGAAPFPVSRTSVRFAGPNGMKITWYAPSADGQMQFAPSSLEAPARYNFSQAAIYRLKLSNIPGLPGVELYPTLEVVPANAKTATFLAHSSVPVTFTRDDFEQVSAGNYLVKVIYLPFPQYQDLAAAGPFEIVSTRLEPGVDPIKEAQSRGHILLVIRLGNIDLEAPNTPAMDAPAPFAPHGPHHSMGGPGMP